MDRLYRQNRRALSRKGPAIAGFVFAAVGLLGSLMVDGVMAKVLFLSVAIFGADMTLPPSWAFCIDVGRQHAGAVAGTMNMAGNLGSFVTSLAFPYLLAATGSPAPFFVVGAGLNVLAAMLWLAAKPLQPIESDVRQRCVIGRGKPHGRDADRLTYLLTNLLTYLQTRT